MDTLKQSLQTYVTPNSLWKVSLWILLFVGGIILSVLLIKGVTSENVEIGLSWIKFTVFLIILVTVISFLFCLIGYFKFRNVGYGEKILTPDTINSEIERFVYDCVHRISREVGLPRAPVIKIVNNEEPNAMAMSLSRSHSIVIIFTGLLEKLSKEEIEAVIAHEIGHIYNRDSLISTFLYFFFKTLWAIFVVIPYLLLSISIAMSKDNKHKGFGLFVVNVLFMIITKIFFFYSALIMNLHSRLREFRADRFSAIVTSPNSMIRVLETLKILSEKSAYSNRYDTLKFYMPGFLFDFLSTHPNLDRRIRAINEFVAGRTKRTSEEKKEILFGGILGFLTILFSIYIFASQGGSAREPFNPQVINGNRSVQTQQGYILSEIPNYLSPDTRTFMSFLYNCNADDRFLAFYYYLYNRRKDLAVVDKEKSILIYQIRGELYGLPITEVWMGICDPNDYLAEDANACGYARYLVLITPRPVEEVRLQLWRRTGIDFTQEIRSPDVEATLRAYLKEISSNITGIVCDPGSL